MKLFPEFIIDEGDCGTFVFQFETNLLEDYFDLFKELMDRQFSSLDIKVDSIDRNSSNSVSIKIDARKLNDSPFSKLKDTIEAAERDGDLDGSVDYRLSAGPKMNSIFLKISIFIETALNSRQRSTEIIPLEGYSFDNLRKEIIEAIKDKRNFYIVKDYSEFLAAGDNSKDLFNRFVYNQYKIKYGTREYADVALMIHEGREKELIENYKDKLVKENWV